MCWIARYRFTFTLECKRQGVVPRTLTFLILFCLCAFYEGFIDYPLLFIIPRVGIELILVNENTNKISILQKIRYYGMFTLNAFSTSVLIFSLLIVTFDVPTYWP